MGRLLVVATPIGNLDDLGPRAARALVDADLVCAEDTRRTGRLLAHVGSDAPQWAVHDHNERLQVPAVLDRLAAGATVALVSDAGTPMVSDPGHRIVAAAIDAGHDVVPVPGPSAVVAALAASGLAADRFTFEGFLPRRGAARSRRLAQLSLEPRTMVLFVAPHRAGDDLTDLADACGDDRRACLAREVTKLHEQFLRGNLAELAAHARDGVRGEVTVVIAGAPAPVTPATADLVELVDDLQASGLRVKDAVKQVAGAHGVATRTLYDAVHESRGRPG